MTKGYDWYVIKVRDMGPNEIAEIKDGMVEELLSTKDPYTAIKKALYRGKRVETSELLGEAPFWDLGSNTIMVDCGYSEICFVTLDSTGKEGKMSFKGYPSVKDEFVLNGFEPHRANLKNGNVLFAHPKKTESYIITPNGDALVYFPADGIAATFTSRDLKRIIYECDKNLNLHKTDKTIEEALGLQNDKMLKNGQRLVEKLQEEAVIDE